MAGGSSRASWFVGDGEGRSSPSGRRASCCRRRLSPSSRRRPINQQGGEEEHGMVGYLPCALNSTTNDIHRLSFGRHVAVGDVAPGFHKVGGRCYPWAVVSFRKWSFASVGGRFRCRRSFVFVSGRCRSFAFVGGHLRSWAVVFVGDCRWRWRSVVVVDGGVVMRWLW